MKLNRRQRRIAKKNNTPEEVVIFNLENRNNRGGVFSKLLKDKVKENEGRSTSPIENVKNKESLKSLG